MYDGGDDAGKGDGNMGGGGTGGIGDMLGLGTTVGLAPYAWGNPVLSAFEQGAVIMCQ